MSTTDSASATPGTNEASRIARSSLSPSSLFQKLQDRPNSEAGSSTSGSRWSVGNPQSRSPSDFRAKASTIYADDKKPARLLSSNYEPRNKNRNSGGFLLESTTHSSRLSRALLSRTRQDPKGKRKSEIPGLSVSKRTRNSVLEQDASNKGSPLSVGATQDQDSLVYGDDLEALNNDGGRSLDGNSGAASSQRSAARSVGLDLDAAQIVDIALKLSEGRRRQASGMRLASGQAIGKRVVSTASSRQLLTPTKGQIHRGDALSLPSSRPLPDSSVLNGTIDRTEDVMQVDGPSAAFKLDATELDPPEGLAISRATASRVQKAKTYLELAYEHRRLLSHLPPIRQPGGHIKDTNTTGSKCYNPLQYARNRKFRIREKSAIDAEAEGWHDIEKVRAWVDAVMHSHTETTHDPLECVRLPPLSLREKIEDGLRSPELPTSPRSPRPQPTRPRRPKSDWVTHPGDLIADAFWLEQGLNKTKIQDRDNNAIYPANTTFKFSGWRNRTPGNIPEGLQQPSPPPEETLPQQGAPPLAAAPELPTFRSTHKKDRDISRGRKKLKLKGGLTKSQSRSRRRKAAFADSNSDFASDSDASSQSESRTISRGRKHNIPKFNLPDGDPFGRPVSTADRGAKVNGLSITHENNISGLDSKRSSIDQFRFPLHLRGSSTAKSASLDRGRSKGPAAKHHLFHRSKDSVDYGKADRSSFEDDSTTPHSPAQYGLPSIAINLDPPISRSPSPTKKSRSSLFASLKDKSKTAEHDKIETNDFAKWPSISHSRAQSQDARPHHDNSNETSRGTSPFTRGTSPSTRLRQESTAQEDLGPTDIEHRDIVTRKTSTRPLSNGTQYQPSRIRGMFKGGRIAELVGNEVSRMGDFIWKRDVPPDYRFRVSGSDTSLRAYELSDTDEDSHSDFQRYSKPREPRQSTSTLASSEQGSPEDRKTTEKPVLHNPNLPSFTSPFQRDRDKQDQKQDLLVPEPSSGSDDHISRQAAQQRSRSKTPRLDRLAPPKLDTSGPRSVGVMERMNSYGFGDSMKRSQSASRALNHAISAKSDYTQSTRDSNASLAVNSRSGDSKLPKRQAEVVCKRDLARLQALLLITTVKAKNINDLSEQIPLTPSKLLLDTAKTAESRSNAHRTRRRDQHIIGAQNLILQLDEHINETNKRLQAFSSSTVAQLHQELQTLEDQVENRITPRVRAAADEAGELSVMLTTKSTQAVKSMHDTVSEAFRLRRRGPSRWLRLFGYTLIEWAVVGLLWFIWAIVTFVRIFIGFFRITGRSVRWLLWID